LAGMVTCAVIPYARDGTYCVVATSPDGTRTTIGTYLTEQDAMTRLKYLQERAETAQQRLARSQSR
jgi:hypothetical protein